MTLGDAAAASQGVRAARKRRRYASSAGIEGDGLVCCIYGMIVQAYHLGSSRAGHHRLHLHGIAYSVNRLDSNTIFMPS